MPKSQLMQIARNIRRVAGCATSTGSAGHAPAGATANSKLTFHPDHSVGADQMASSSEAAKILERALPVFRKSTDNRFHSR
jgi:hypothetical protein